MSSPITMGSRTNISTSITKVKDFGDVPIKKLIISVSMNGDVYIYFDTNPFLFCPANTPQVFVFDVDKIPFNGVVSVAAVSGLVSGRVTASGIAD